LAELLELSIGCQTKKVFASQTIELSREDLCFLNVACPKAETSHSSPDLECSGLAELLDLSIGCQTKIVFANQTVELSREDLSFLNVARPKAVTSHSSPNLECSGLSQL